ncbi:MAG: hypothetical protein HQ481_13530, partial [Alphaproteobacteria bacterium]|nr:hypothetical protein [Alphaproteobacteria bacterium]
MEIQALPSSADVQRPQDHDVASQSGGVSEAINHVRSVPGEFFISPVLKFDSRALTVVFQVRDSESGDVTRQFPSEAVVERYRNDPTTRPFVPSVPAEATDDAAVFVDRGATGPSSSDGVSGSTNNDNGAPTVASSSSATPSSATPSSATPS